MIMNPNHKLIILLFLIPTFTFAQKEKENIIQSLNGKQAHYAEVAKKIWEYAEPGYLEVKSSTLLQSELSKAGFKVEKGVAGIPTAFVASYGSGKPIIGILGEFDALPGLSQEAFVPERKIIVDGAPGHGCGHNLFGTGSMAAAIEIKNWLVNSKKQGTIKYYGTPAEEAGDAKVFMVKAGLFDDVDAVITWHAGDRNEAGPSTNLATLGDYGHSQAVGQTRDRLDDFGALVAMAEVGDERPIDLQRVDGEPLQVAQ